MKILNITFHTSETLACKSIETELKQRDIPYTKLSNQEIEAPYLLTPNRSIEGFRRIMLYITFHQKPATQKSNPFLDGIC